MYVLDYLLPALVAFHRKPRYLPRVSQESLRTVSQKAPATRGITGQFGVEGHFRIFFCRTIQNKLLLIHRIEYRISYDTEPFFRSICFVRREKRASNS